MMRWDNSRPSLEWHAWNSSSSALLASWDDADEWDKWSFGDVALLVLVMALTRLLPRAIARITQQSRSAAGSAAATT